MTVMPAIFLPSLGKNKWKVICLACLQSWSGPTNDRPWDSISHGGTVPITKIAIVSPYTHKGVISYRPPNLLVFRSSMLVDYEIVSLQCIYCD